MRDEAEIRDELERMDRIATRLVEISEGNMNPIAALTIVTTLEPMRAIAATLRWVLDMERSDGTKANLREVVDDWEKAVEAAA